MKIPFPLQLEFKLIALQTFIEALNQIPRAKLLIQPSDPVKAAWERINAETVKKMGWEGYKSFAFASAKHIMARMFCNWYRAVPKTPYLPRSLSV